MLLELKSLLDIANQIKQKIKYFNCGYLSLAEMREELGKAGGSDEYILLKNVHLASQELIDYIRIVCESPTTSKRICSHFEPNKYTFHIIILPTKRLQPNIDQVVRVHVAAFGDQQELTGVV